MTAIVTPTPAAHGNAMWDRYLEPERWTGASTIRLVRLDPGRSDDPAFDRSRQAASSAVASVRSRRLVWTAIGVRKATEVSRFRTAVTANTIRHVPAKRVEARRLLAASQWPANEKRWSPAATEPTSNRPETRTKAGQV